MTAVAVTMLHAGGRPTENAFTAPGERGARRGTKGISCPQRTRDAEGTGSDFELRDGSKRP